MTDHPTPPIEPQALRRRYEPPVIQYAREILSDALTQSEFQSWRWAGAVRILLNDHGWLTDALDRAAQTEALARAFVTASFAADDGLGARVSRTIEGDELVWAYEDSRDALLAATARPSVGTEGE